MYVWDNDADEAIIFPCHKRGASEEEVVQELVCKEGTRRHN